MHGRDAHATYDCNIMNLALAQATLILLIVGITACWCSGAAAAAPTPAAGAKSKLVFPGPGGKLQYTPDEEGNVIPDFSNCGYRGGGVRLPDVPVKAQLSPDTKSKDDTARIQ